MATPVTLANAYDAIVTYQNIGDPAVRWRNTYTFHSDTVPIPGAGIVGAIGTFAVGMVHSDVELVELSVYNWSRGRLPYPSGSPLFSTISANPGLADSHWPHLTTPYTANAGEVSLRSDHQPQTAGKPGRSFFRALLGAGDITAISGGRWSLKSPVSTAGLQSDMEALLTVSTLKTYMSAGAPGGQELVVVRFSKKLNAVFGSTLVTDFVVLGVTTNKNRRTSRR